MSAESGVEVFGAERIVPGVWALTPTLSIPGLIHVFVVLYDAPATWDGTAIAEQHRCEGCSCSESEPCKIEGGCSWSEPFLAVGRWVCTRCVPSMMRHQPPEAAT